MPRIHSSDAPLLRRPKPKPRRAPGRPVGGGADQRRELIDAAMRCFARQGIAATSLRSIAAAAAVTPAMLHYYFGDKNALRDAFIRERLLPVFLEIRGRLVAAQGDIGDFVKSFVTGVNVVVERNPWLPPLWVRDVLTDGGTLRELLLGSAPGGLPQMLAQKFSVAQQAGELDAELDPRFLVLSLVGLTMFAAAGAPVWKQIFQTEELNVEALQRHTLALLARGLGLKHAL